jgi:ferric-dicitrate binding protein FerR (iron transport regulator)
MNESDPQPWLADMRARLDESTQSFDAATLSRLNQARQAALAARSRSLRAWWLPAAGLAASCAFVLAAVAWYPSARLAGPATPAHAVVSESEIAADDGIEFYQDLDFYAWLDAQDDESGG